MTILPFMIVKGMNYLTILTAVLALLTLIPARAESKNMTLGEIELTGNFTLNPAYSFNQPSAQPFGSFSNLSLTDATGIFTPLFRHGDALVMNSLFLLSPPFSAPADSKPLAGQMIWSINGYSLDTTWTLITGADFVGRNVLGLVDISGRQFDHGKRALGSNVFWNFTAPPYDITNFTQPVTGPITLTITAPSNRNSAGHGQSASQVERFSQSINSQNLTVIQVLNKENAIPEPSPLLLLGVTISLLTCGRYLLFAKQLTAP